MNFLKKIIFEIKNYLQSDLVKNCSLYKEKGCAHVDGFLCDYPNCWMFKEYKHYQELKLYKKFLEEGKASYIKANEIKYKELKEKYDK